MVNSKPKTMNLELTTCCPLRCPQCYCTLEGGKHLDVGIAKKCLSEAAEMGVCSVNLSGGETMCYPHLYEIVAFAASCKISPNVAVSGYHFDASVLQKLIENGMNGIFVSLNGSTKEINSLTRDGYELALYALSVLKEADYSNSFINWVMHSYNADDFENVVKIAEDNHIRNIVILSFKPDSKHELKSFPSAEQILNIADFIKHYKGSVRIMVETCFSQLLAVIRDTKLYGNLNVGPMKGCGAGRWSFSVSVDGQFSPCRHLDYYESWNTVDEYWEHSSVLIQLRNAESDMREPCSQCHYSPNCRHCMAINSKLHGELYLGHEKCGLHNTC